MITIVIYDISKTKIRNKVIEKIMDYGLTRIQFSVFAGKINKNMRENLAIAMRNCMLNEDGNIQIFLVDEDEYMKKLEFGRRSIL